MRFPCHITHLTNGAWSAHHESKDIGSVDVKAATRDEVIDKMRNEIRYRLELCPCSGESYQYIDVDIVDG